MTGREAADREQFCQLSACDYNLREHSMKLSKQRTSLDVLFQSACDKRGEAAIPQDVVDGTSVTPVQELSGQVLAKIWVLKSWLNKYISTELSNALHDM